MPPTPKPPARARRPMHLVTGVLVLAVIEVMVALTASTPAGAETPAERCARETAAYNQTWKQGWVATHPGKSISDAPAPTPPYVCQDPATQTPTTTQPSVTAPSMPTTTTPGSGGGPNINAHGATDIPAPGTTPIVPVPSQTPAGAGSPIVENYSNRNLKCAPGYQMTPPPHVGNVAETSSPYCVQYSRLGRVDPPGLRNSGSSFMWCDNKRFEVHYRAVRQSNYSN